MQPYFLKRRQHKWRKALTDMYLGGRLGVQKTLNSIPEKPKPSPGVDYEHLIKRLHISKKCVNDPTVK